MPEDLSFSSTFLLCVDLFLVMHCIILMHYFIKLYSNKTQAKFIRLQSASGIMEEAAILLLMYRPPLLPTIKRYTLSSSDNVIVSQLKEKLVSLKKYQYVLLVRRQSK